MKRIDSHYLRITSRIAAFGAAIALSIASGSGATDRTTSSANETLVIERAIEQFKLDTTISIITLRRGLDHVPELREFSLKVLTAGEPRGMVPALLEYTAIDGSVGRSQMSFSIRFFDSVLVATTQLKRGLELTDGSTHSEWKDITDFRESPLRYNAQSAGMRLRRNISAGKIITANAFEVIPDVEFGDEVTIEFISGHLALHAAGVALEKGVMGEAIRVRNVTSKKIIRAKITAPGVVAAAFGK